MSFWPFVHSLPLPYAHRARLLDKLSRQLTVRVFLSLGNEATVAFGIVARLDWVWVTERTLFINFDAVIYLCYLE